jgi:hypothetical protein
MFEENILFMITPTEKTKNKNTNRAEEKLRFLGSGWVIGWGNSNCREIACHSIKHAQPN